MKQFEVQFEIRAEVELNEAFDYYAAISFKLAERFYEEALAASELLARDAYFQVRYKQVRCLTLKGFPYMIHYTIDEANSLVKIEAIIHCRKNPETTWLVNEP